MAFRRLERVNPQAATLQTSAGRWYMVLERTEILKTDLHSVFDAVPGQSADKQVFTREALMHRDKECLAVPPKHQ